MAWFVDTYSTLKVISPGVVTGKPIALGGSLGRASEQRSRYYVCNKEIARKGLSLKGARAVQGAGNVGGVAAKLIHRRVALLLQFLMYLVESTKKTGLILTKLSLS